MSNDKMYSAQITILITKGQKRRLEILNLLKGKKTSEVVRDIIEDYLKRNNI